MAVSYRARAIPSPILMTVIKGGLHHRKLHHDCGSFVANEKTALCRFIQLKQLVQVNLHPKRQGSSLHQFQPSGSVEIPQLIHVPQCLLRSISWTTISKMPPIIPLAMVCTGICPAREYLSPGGGAPPCTGGCTLPPPPPCYGQSAHNWCPPHG